MTSIDDVIRLLEAAKATPGSLAKTAAPKKAAAKPKRKASAYSKKYAIIKYLECAFVID